jgi:hypothetical protein
MRFALDPFTLIICSTRMFSRSYLNKGNDVQAPVELAISAGVNSDGLVPTARTYDGSNAGAHGERAGVTTVVEISGVTNKPSCDNGRNARERE